MVRVLVTAFASALFAAGTAAAQAPAQFDLVCQGDAVGVATQPGAPSGSHITARFHVDTLHDQFCVDACTRMMPISAIVGDQVQVQVEDAAYTLMPETNQFAYRSEGEIESFGGGGCRMAAFTPSAPQ